MNRGIEMSNDKLGGLLNNMNSYRRYLCDEGIRCRSIWRAVILQSILDIVGNSKRTEDKVEKSFAMQWALEDNEDFYMVCSLAEYRPSYVRNQISSIIKERKVSRKFIQSMKAKIKSESPIKRSTSSASARDRLDTSFHCAMPENSLLQ